jgi:protease II
LPPSPRRREKAAELHPPWLTLTDDYAWLRDPGYPEVKDPEILAHLEAENAWFQANMAPRQPLIDRLFAEMRGRIKEADKSVPQKDGDWLYWIEYEEGAEYKKWWRRPVGAADDGSADELILDEVALAQGHDYFRLGAISVSTTGACSPGRWMTTARNALPRGSRSSPPARSCPTKSPAPIPA